jgi:hypothetical protein
MNVHLDAMGFAYFPQRTENAYVAVNLAVCDADGDGIEDAQDACDFLAGPPSSAGCPPPGQPFAVGGTAGLIEVDGGARSARGESDAQSAAWLMLSAGAASVIAAAGAVWALKRLPVRRPDR